MPRKLPEGWVKLWAGVAGRKEVDTFYAPDTRTCAASDLAAHGARADKSPTRRQSLSGLPGLEGESASQSRYSTGAAAVWLALTLARYASPRAG